jgi:hypothetical protein
VKTAGVTVQVQRLIFPLFLHWGKETDWAGDREENVK